MRQLLLDSHLTDSMAGRLLVAAMSRRPARGVNDVPPPARQTGGFASRLSRGLFGFGPERSSMGSGVELTHGEQLGYQDVVPVYNEGMVCLN